MSTEPDPNAGAAAQAARDATLKTFERIRVFQRGEQRAVHKPLLILYALGRIARGEARMVEFAQMEGAFKQLLTEFGPSSAGASRHYPFWHLASDDHGALWQLQGPAELLRRPSGATPNLGELRSLHVQGGFAPELDARLRADPVLVSQLARRILDAHFPETLHADLLDAVGLDASETASTQDTIERRRRDPAFREKVLRAYEHRCCVCGFDLRIGNISAGLEAAHIQWFQAKGPDVEANGFALCALHHKIFDLGAFTVLPDSYTLVFSQHVAMGDATRKALLGYHGAGIILPQSQSYYPDPRYLRWHEKEVFKKPGRELVVSA